MKLASNADDLRTRMCALTVSAMQGVTITSKYIRERFNVSRAVSKRDMQVIEQMLPLARHTVLSGKKIISSELKLARAA